MKTCISTTMTLMVTATLLFFSCKTEPIIPAGGIPTDPPVQDPGLDNLCAEGVVSFQHEILPLLISSCAYSGCHNAASHREGVVLDTYERILREVRPGNAGRSSLYKSLVDHGDDIMPPPPAAPLSSEQITLVRNWIDQGAENTSCGTACDSQEASFSANVYPLIQNYCVGCHSTSRADGGVNLETYQRIRSYAQSGALVGTISHDPYYPSMPPSGSIVSNCRIDQVKKWIDEGAQNN